MWQALCWFLNQAIPDVCRFVISSPVYVLRYFSTDCVCPFVVVVVLMSKHTPQLSGLSA